MCHPLVALPLSLIPALGESTKLGGTEGPDLTRYFIVCATLLVVTAAVAWGFRRLFSGNLRHRAGQRSLHVMDVLPLGGKRRIAVVRCYDRTFVLGLGDHEISPIAELDPVIGPTSTPPPTKADQAAFVEALERVRAAMPAKPIAQKGAALDSAPRPTVKKKVRRRKVKVVKAPGAKELSVPKQNASEAVVAEAARKMARARRVVAQAAQHPGAAVAPAPPKTPAAPPIQRLEGLLG